VLTYNLASGGATVDSNVVEPFASWVLSFKQQLRQLSQYYPLDSRSVGWTPDDSLFAIWLGINDVGISYSRSDYSSVEPQIILAYNTTLNQLYSLGARNFLILNVPPVDQSPGTTKYGANASAMEKVAIQGFNTDLASMLSGFKKDYSDITYFLYDTNSLFTNILANPSLYSQTQTYTVMNACCQFYANNDAPGVSPANLSDSFASEANPTDESLPQSIAYSPSCGVPVNQYFWFDDLHPTYQVHQVLAQEIAGTLIGSNGLSTASRG
jgi:phospholipase/lecithinase/hemolysin